MRIQCLALCVAVAILSAACSGSDASSADPRPGATTSAAPTTTNPTAPPAAPAPRLFDQDVLDTGTYLVDKFGTPLHVTVPATGWSTFADYALTSPEGFEVGYIGFWEVDDVTLDACHRNERANIGPSVDELVTALVAQGGMDVTEPAPIDVDGRAGQSVTLSPADVDPATCDDGVVSPWFESDGDARFYVQPSETETLWIIDIDGRRAVINVGSVIQMTPATRAQLDEMLASIRIG
jgi:hypothetical protein